MAESTPRHELTVPEGFAVVPGMEDVDILMRQFAQGTLQTLLSSDHVPTLLVPLNGGIVPLRYLLEEAKNTNPPLFDQILNNVRFLHTQKNGDVAICEALFEGSLPNNTNLVVIEDIIDSGGTIESIRRRYPNQTQLTVLAPTSKPGSLDRARTRTPEVTIEATQEIPDEWVLSGAGMDDGKKYPGEQYINVAKLAAYQRLCRTGYYLEDGATAVSFEDQLAFFKSALLPWVQDSPELLEMMIELELNKQQHDNSSFQMGAHYLQNNVNSLVTTQ